jgi:hypothetical protein
MLPTDSADAAKFEQDAITDARLRCWFDADKGTANSWSSSIGLPVTTWDVYAIYDGAAEWSKDEPPPPRIWMHQLNPSPATQPADRLDPVRLARDWLALIGGDIEQSTELAVRLHARGQAASVRGQ